MSRDASAASALLGLATGLLVGVVLGIFTTPTIGLSVSLAFLVVASLLIDLTTFRPKVSPPAAPALSTAYHRDGPRACPRCNEKLISPGHTGLDRIPVWICDSATCGVTIAWRLETAPCVVCGSTGVRA